MLNFEVMTDKQFRPKTGEYIIRLGLRTSLADHAETLPLNICLLIDCSVSMMGEKLDQAKEAAKGLISGLNDGDLISIIQFASAAEVLVDKMRINSESMDKALAAVDKIDIAGATLMDLGLSKAYEVISGGTRGYLPHLLMLSDGAPTDDTGHPLDNKGHAVLFNMVSKAHSDNNISTSSVGLGSAEECLAPFLESLGEKGSGVFYHVADVQELVKRFMEELNRAQNTAISEFNIHLKNVHGAVRKAVAVLPEVRILPDTGKTDSGYLIKGGGLQKGEIHVFLIEIITPPYTDMDKKALCRIKAVYRDKHKEHTLEGNTPVIEYTEDNHLLGQSGNEEMEKYKSMHMAFLQTQKAIENIREKGDDKKTRVLISSAAKTTRMLGMSKQTKILEDLDAKIENNAHVSENDITAVSVSSRKTKILGN